jgi:DNA-directed RNA polymerase specialized sigma24 family protein
MDQINAANSGTESFEKILSDKEHNKKWLNFARKELRGHRNRENARHKEAEDYVEDAKLKILSGEGLPDEGIRNIDNYICGFIKKEISAELKKSLVMISISNLRDNECDEDREENGNGCKVSEGAGARVEENLVVLFEDPFEEKVDKMGTWEIMQICFNLLEKEEPEMLVVFDERAKGHPNREIAEYLCVEVREVENMWKRVVRLLKKSIPFNHESNMGRANKGEIC